MTAEAKGDQF